jgi:hypothetical protein
MRRLMLLLATIVALTGCATMGFQLVSPGQVSVANNSMKVRPSISWNKSPAGLYDIPQEESWTENGPLLDGVTFIGALPSGQAIAKQKPKDDRKVPVFRADMTPQDLTSMVESYYRIKLDAKIFDSTSVKPAIFLGKPGVQFDYKFIGSDEVKRLGRSVFAVIDGKLYLMSLDGAAVHYFNAALPEFETIVASASLP